MGIGLEIAGDDVIVHGQTVFSSARSGKREMESGTKMGNEDESRRQPPPESVDALTSLHDEADPKNAPPKITVELSIVEGPYAGQRFEFREANRFLVGRGLHAHFRLPTKDKYFSRSHFLIEIHPPLCVIFDLESTNGTYVNGQRINECALKSGDRISGGKTVFVITIHGELDETSLIRNPRPKPILANPVPVLPKIPGYQIIEQVGQGGMGWVYRAIRDSDQQLVAIKTIQPAVPGTKEDYDRFLREIRILRNLNHPTIVRYLKEVEVDGLLYLVMEFVDGMDARKLVQSRGPMSIEQAVRITQQFLSGLMYAHENGYVHRDVKPANLLVHQDGKEWRVKLADFGLARTYLTSQLSGCTPLGQIGGTIAFMPPEQLTQFREALPASDQYSAAATLYWLLTGHHAYDFPRPVYLQLAALMNNEPIPIQNRRPDIPDKLATVIHRAMSRDPENRYPKVADFATELATSV